MQTAFPIEDTFVGDYFDQDDGVTDIFNSINEAVHDPDDFISGPRPPAGEMYICKMEPLNDPGNHNAHQAFFGLQKPAGITDRYDAVIEWREGVIDENNLGTLIGTVSFADLGTSPNIVGISLTSGEAATITDYTDQYLVFYQQTFSEPPSSEPWIVPFTAVDEIFVTNNSEFATALSTAAPGDDIIVMDGTILTGNYIPTVNGTIANPIRIRAENWLSARLDGSLDLDGDYYRVEDMIITGRTANGNVAAIDITDCPGATIINNFLPWNTFPAGTAQGVSAFNGSTPNHIVYGNIMYNRRHSLYIQNDWDTNGLKYIVGNMMLEAGDNGTGNRFHFHGYTQSSRVSGMYIRKNIYKSNKSILGIDSGAETDTQVDYENTLAENCFYKSSFQMGNNRPIDFVCNGNYFGKSVFLTERSDLIQVENNLFMPDPDNSDYMFKFRTGESNIPAIEPGTIWDNNEYYGDFKGSYASDGVFHAGVTSFASWKTHALNIGGFTFDAASTHTAGLPPDEVFQFQNDYRPEITYAIVYNWSLGANESITVPYASGTVYEVQVVGGTSIELVEHQTFASSTFNITMDNQECRVFIIVED